MIIRTYFDKNNTIVSNLNVNTGLTFYVGKNYLFVKLKHYKVDRLMVD